jgi:hypothetical protein
MLATTASLAAIAIAGAGSVMASDDDAGVPDGSLASTAAVAKLHLDPASAQLKACFPNSHVDITVKETVDDVGFDSFNVRARGLPKNTAFTVFLLQQAETPFGAAEYIGDFFTDSTGKANNTFKLIVSEAFSSTLVNGTRVRQELNRVGAWFADPADDDFCLGAGSPVTPFDGDNEAGVQALNSRNSPPLPAP